jgi:hypothetical protein
MMLRPIWVWREYYEIKLRGSEGLLCTGLSEVPGKAGKHGDAAPTRLLR